jgi:hypothetical protein
MEAGSEEDNENDLGTVMNVLLDGLVLCDFVAWVFVVCDCGVGLRVRRLGAGGFPTRAGDGRWRRRRR